MTGNEIMLYLAADNADLKAKLRESENALNRFSKQGETSGRGFKASWNAATAAIAGFGVAIAGAVRFIGSAIRAYNEQIKVEKQLEAVLKSTGHAAGLSAVEIKTMAAKLQSLTTYGDEAILGAQNILLTFTKIGKEVFPEATETVLDMSTALGQDLKSSAIQLGKALNDPITGMTALRRVGVSFTEQQVAQVKALVASGKALEAQRLIIRELKTEFGGSARAQALTLEGSLTQLKNSWGDFQETMVDGFSDGLTTMAQNLTKFVNWMNRILLSAQIAQIEHNIKHYKQMYDIAIDQATKEYAAGKLAALYQKVMKMGGEKAPAFSGATAQNIANKAHMMELAEYYKYIGNMRKADEADAQAGLQKMLIADNLTTDQKLVGYQAYRDKMTEIDRKYDTGYQLMMAGQMQAFTTFASSLDQANRQLVYNMLWGKGGWKSFEKGLADIFKQLLADIAYAIARALILQAIIGATGGGGGLIGRAVLGRVFEKGYVPSYQKGRIPAYPTGYVPMDHHLAYIGSKEAVIRADSTRANLNLLRWMNKNPGQAVGGDTTIHNVLTLDGEVVFENVERRRQDRARNLGAGNYARQSVYK